jgi:hypothetical protein
MGQLNFFMTNNEIVELISSLILSGDYIVFEGKFFRGEIPNPFHGEGDISKSKNLVIWVRNSIYYPKCTSIGSEKMTGNFLFDVYKDPVIEFDLGQSNDKLLSPGRLFYKTGWIENEELRQKHTKFTNKVVRTFKKHLFTNPSLSPFYISQGIKELLKDGYELELGRGGMRLGEVDLNYT